MGPVEDSTKQIPEKAWKNDHLILEVDFSESEITPRKVGDVNTAALLPKIA